MSYVGCSLDANLREPTRMYGGGGLLCGVDFEGDVELGAGVEGADVLDGAFFAGELGPELAVGVGGDLAEAEGAVVGGDVALDGQRAAILEIDGGALDAGAGAADHLALDHALGLRLREEPEGRRSKRGGQRSQAAEEREEAGKAGGRV